MDLRAKILSGLETIPLVDPSMQPEIALLAKRKLLSRRRLRGAVRCGDWRLARAAAIALVSLWDRRSAPVLWQRVFRDGWRGREKVEPLREVGESRAGVPRVCQNIARMAPRASAAGLLVAVHAPKPPSGARWGRWPRLGRI